MDALPNAENMVFDLRKKADLYLQAGNTGEYNRTLTTISHLQQLYGAVNGAEREKENAKPA